MGVGEERKGKREGEWEGKKEGMSRQHGTESEICNGKITDQKI